MLHAFFHRAICAALLLFCCTLVHAEPIHRHPYREPRDSQDDPTVAAAFHALSSKFWNSVSERSPDIRPDLGAPAQHDLRYQLIKRQGGSGIVTNSTPSVTPPTPTPTPSSTPQQTSTNQPASTTPNASSSPSSSPSSPSTPQSSAPSSPAQTSSPASASSTPSDRPSSPSSTSSPQVTQQPSSSTSAFSSTLVGTTTNDKGDLITYTSVVLVQPSRTTPTRGPTSTAGRPGLQTNGVSAPSGMKKEMFAMLGGAVVVAIAL
ncbi:hypothetical protein LOZ53_003859 [Ophidiomyces ophidiicola]|nr:hypothetical protein LOZ55_000577 [Ophidiomyces ophidiicola]KAI1988691.1 hypothetical protein LOZ53_003859 [Ophidiomyces ophidiicola]KAI1989375.1 hypothetical protein LOZ51_005187 [Ophidiomyces ophidiicola]KAI1990977.1 hypothetical protein LOZ54_002254 [Ophidiomyces ophidiicola]